MKTIRERLEELMPTEHCYVGTWLYDKNQVLDALEKHAKVVYFKGQQTDCVTIGAERAPSDTHTALLIDIQPIEPEDSLEKLVQDLAKLVGKDGSTVYGWAEDAKELSDRAKRLTKKD